VTRVRFLGIVSSVLAILLTFTCVFQIIERVPWHEAFFFASATLTTIGASGHNIRVMSTVGKFVTMMLGCVCIILIPVQGAQLYAFLKHRRACHGSLPARDGSFVLLSTRLTNMRSFGDFYREFWHECESQWERSDGRKRLKPKGTKLMAITNKPAFEFQCFQELQGSRLTFMEGRFSFRLLPTRPIPDIPHPNPNFSHPNFSHPDSPSFSSLTTGSVLSEDDLQLVHATRAKAALLVADGQAPHPQEEDRSLLFQVWSLKAYTEHVPLFVQTITKEAMEQIRPFLDPQRDTIVSSEQLRYFLMGIAALCPGAATLVGNLLRSTIGSDTERLGRAQVCTRVDLRGGYVRR
jgi:hypothetical protein